LNEADAELCPLPSPLEAALGLYLRQIHEKRLAHRQAFAEAVEELRVLYPELTPLQANLVMVKAARAAKETR
jgi:hypothetical protein